MKPEYLMLHHSATSHSKNSDQFKAINKYHKNLWDFKSKLGFYVGYNWVISSKGRVRQSRLDGNQTAACYQKDMNDGRCIHICLDGNFDIEKPKPEQIYALRDLIIDLVAKYKIKKQNILAHNQYANKTCPGINLDMEFVRRLAPGLIKEDDKKEKLFKKIDELKDIINEIL